MKFGTIIVILFLLPFSVWAGTFVETFDGGDLDEWQEIIMLDFRIDPETWQVIDGELHGTMRHLGLPQLLTTGDEKWRNYTIEVDVFPLEKHAPGNIGIAARIQGTVGIISLIGDYPFPFLPDPDAELTTTCFGGDFHKNILRLFGSGVSPLLELETWSTMKLQANEDVFRLWLNGEQVLLTRDDTFNFSTGRVGLVLAGYTVKFDNLVISGDGIPNKGRLSVTPRDKLATTWGNLKQF